MKQLLTILYKRNFILLKLLIILILTQTTSCKKYLDKKADTSLTTISRVEDLQAMLDRNDLLNFEVLPVYGEVSSNDYFSFQPGYEGSGEKGLLAYKWQYFSESYSKSGGGSAINDDWAHGYIAANTSNICLEEIEKFPKTTANELQWNNVKGSAFFFRAFCFLNLTWIYAKAYDSITSSSDPGIALRLSVDDHTPTFPTIRATVAESYEQVLSDAKAAVSYLPAIAVHPLRPSKAAAYGLLARAYLSMRVYDSAFKYADLCLGIRSELIDYNGDADIIAPINGINPPFRKYNKETVFYADMSTNPLGYLVTYGNVDTSLYDMYSDYDIRKQAFFAPDVNGYKKFKGSYAQSTNIRFGGIATDEMLLIRAECYARKGFVTEAMNDLNALMIKRWKNDGSWVPFTAIDATDALNKVLAESRKELLFRGLRWMDIKRLNKGGANIILKRIVDGQPYELLPNTDRYALPIPEDIIKLTGIPQNAGWL